ncbi:MAG: hypothetical protein JXR49_12075 [Acidobacteria bacterium]|nr:hypothetical protein [Acidobacteriota bacterium]
MKRTVLFTVLIVSVCLILLPSRHAAETGTFTYDDFSEPKQCSICHGEIYREWQQSLMSQSFTHPWDDVEYFKLALPQALKLEKVADVKSGCIGCHAPVAFLAGDIPPQPPAAGTRANEGVSCDICHGITGSTEEVPYNFSYRINPGKVKYGSRKDAEPQFHETEYSAFTGSPELCANCHDEQSPYGAWVKETYREWAAGPYGSQGVRCQDCHMHYAPGKSTPMGKERDDIAHHVFHGPHFDQKLKGSVDLALYADNPEVKRGSRVVIRAELYNGKVGHYIPSGSSEERMLWLEVQVVDGKGNAIRIPVDKKGFAGEEFTIADSQAFAYQAMGEIMEIPGYKGIARDGNLPDGSRIFRRPYFDPKGRMTICQWYTEKNTDIDYRIGPRETKLETYTWNVPDKFPSQTAKITATLYYSLVPSSVGEFMKLPSYAYEAKAVNSASLDLTIK